MLFQASTSSRLTDREWLKLMGGTLSGLCDGAAMAGRCWMLTARN